MFWNNEETGSGRLADGYAGRLSGKTENAFFAFAAEEAFFCTAIDSFYKEFTVICWKMQYLWVNISI